MWCWYGPLLTCGVGMVPPGTVWRSFVCAVPALMVEATVAIRHTAVRDIHTHLKTQQENVSSAISRTHAHTHASMHTYSLTHSITDFLIHSLTHSPSPTPTPTHSHSLTPTNPPTHLPLHSLMNYKFSKHIALLKDCLEIILATYIGYIQININEPVIIEK